jgi:5-methylcytosine-specific restriction endonuclease McrA
MPGDKKNTRPDHNGTHRGAFEKNKKRIYATHSVCGICGLPVDFTKKYPHPLSPCIDHIIPIAKGGHPSDINNLQLAHWICNRQKSDKLLMSEKKEEVNKEVGNNVLPWSMDWTHYKSEQTRGVESP